MEYKTFSDNVLISISYFDNQEDFLSNFNLICIYVRAFQYTMMSKGYFVRGAISTGSYYADNEIIFSKGLVNAYLLETQKAVYPRIIVDPQIINKIFRYPKEKIKESLIDLYIVIDWENIFFLNPFNLYDYSIKQLEKPPAGINTEDENDIALQTINNFAKDILNVFSDLDSKNIPIIKSYVIKNLYNYQHDQKIFQKYWWLLEYIKWIEKDNSGRLKFDFLASVIDSYYE